jgi:polyhydroxyalkanoate synthesis regulator phasin
MAVGAVQAFKGALEAPTRAARTALGAQAGAEIGYEFAGPWGAAIGAGVGAIVGLLKGNPAWVEAAKEIGRDMGVAISDELAKKIAADAKKLFHGDRSSAIEFNLGDIIKEGGGVNTDNLDKWTAKLKDVFSFLERGQLNAAQAAKVLKDVFPQLAEVVKNSNELVSKNFLDIIDLAKQTGTYIHEIAAYVNEMLVKAAAGVNTLGGGFATHFNELFETRGKNATDIQDMEDKLKDLIDQRSHAESADQIRKLDAEIKKLSGTLKEAKANQKSLDEQLRVFAEGGQERFDRLGRISVATFAMMVQSGMSVVAAVKALGDNLSALSLAQKNFGFVASESFGFLIKVQDLIKSNPALMDSVDGLNQAIVAFHNAGLMTQSLFTDLSAEAVDVFKSLQENGLTAKEAMLVLQPSLQHIWELQHDFGYEVDSATQALLDEAEASGVVGAAHRSASDKMVAGINTLISRFDLLLNYLGIQVPAAADTAADAVDGIKDHLPDHMTSTIDVDVVYHDPGPPDTSDPQVPDANSFADEGMVASPTLAVIGDAPEPEFVLHRSTLRKMVNDAAKAGANDSNDTQQILRLLRDFPRMNSVAIKDALVLSPRGVR